MPVKPVSEPDEPPAAGGADVSGAGFEEHPAPKAQVQSVNAQAARLIDRTAGETSADVKPAQGWVCRMGLPDGFCRLGSVGYV